MEVVEVFILEAQIIIVMDGNGLMELLLLGPIGTAANLMEEMVRIIWKCMYQVIQH